MEARTSPLPPPGSPGSNRASTYFDAPSSPGPSSRRASLVPLSPSASSHPLQRDANASSSTTSSSTSLTSSSPPVTPSLQSEAQLRLAEKREELIRLREQKDRELAAKKGSKGKGKMPAVVGPPPPLLVGGAAGAGGTMPEGMAPAPRGEEWPRTPSPSARQFPTSASPMPSPMAVPTLKPQRSQGSVRPASPSSTLPAVDITDPFGYSWAESNPYDHALAYSVNPTRAARGTRGNALSSSLADDSAGGRFWIGPSAGALTPGLASSSVGSHSPASSPGLTPVGGMAWSAPPSPMSTPATLASLPGSGQAPPAMLPKLNFTPASSRSIAGMMTEEPAASEHWDPDAEAERVRRAKMENRRSRSLEVTQAELDAVGLGGLTANGVASSAGKRGSLFGRRGSNPVTPTAATGLSVAPRPGTASSPLAPSPLRSASTPTLIDGTTPVNAAAVPTKAALKAEAALRRAKEKEAREAFERLKQERIAEEKLRMAKMKGDASAAKVIVKLEKEAEKRRKKDEEVKRRSAAATVQAANQLSRSVSAVSAPSMSSRKSWFGGLNLGGGSRSSQVKIATSKSVEGRSRTTSEAGSVASKAEPTMSKRARTSTAPAATSTFAVEPTAPPTPTIPTGFATPPATPGELPAQASAASTNTTASAVKPPQASPNLGTSPAFPPPQQPLPVLPPPVRPVSAAGPFVVSGSPVRSASGAPVLGTGGHRRTPSLGLRIQANENGSKLETVPASPVDESATPLDLAVDKEAEESAADEVSTEEELEELAVVDAKVPSEARRPAGSGDSKADGKESFLDLEDASSDRNAKAEAEDASEKAEADAVEAAAQDSDASSETRPDEFVEASSPRHSDGLNLSVESGDSSLHDGSVDNNSSLGIHSSLLPGIVTPTVTTAASSAVSTPKLSLSHPRNSASTDGDSGNDDSLPSTPLSNDDVLYAAAGSDETMGKKGVLKDASAVTTAVREVVIEEVPSLGSPLLGVGVWGDNADPTLVTRKVRSSSLQASQATPIERSSLAPPSPTLSSSPVAGTQRRPSGDLLSMKSTPTAATDVPSRSRSPSPVPVLKAPVRHSSVPALDGTVPATLLSAPAPTVSAPQAPTPKVSQPPPQKGSSAPAVQPAVPSRKATSSQQKPFASAQKADERGMEPATPKKPRSVLSSLFMSGKREKKDRPAPPPASSMPAQPQFAKGAPPVPVQPPVMAAVQVSATASQLKSKAPSAHTPPTTLSKKGHRKSLFPGFSSKGSAPQPDQTKNASGAPPLPVNAPDLPAPSARIPQKNASAVPASSGLFSSFRGKRPSTAPEAGPSGKPAPSAQAIASVGPSTASAASMGAPHTEPAPTAPAPIAAVAAAPIPEVAVLAAPSEPVPAVVSAEAQTTPLPPMEQAPVGAVVLPAIDQKPLFVGSVVRDSRLPPQVMMMRAPETAALGQPTSVSAPTTPVTTPQTRQEAFSSPAPSPVARRAPSPNTQQALSPMPAPAVAQFATSASPAPPTAVVTQLPPAPQPKFPLPVDALPYDAPKSLRSVGIENSPALIRAEDLVAEPHRTQDPRPQERVRQHELERYDEERRREEDRRWEEERREYERRQYEEEQRWEEERRYKEQQRYEERQQREEQRFVEERHAKDQRRYGHDEDESADECGPSYSRPPRDREHSSRDCSRHDRHGSSRSYRDERPGSRDRRARQDRDRYDRDDRYGRDHGRHRESPAPYLEPRSRTPSRRSPSAEVREGRPRASSSASYRSGRRTPVGRVSPIDGEYAYGGADFTRDLAEESVRTGRGGLKRSSSGRSIASVRSTRSIGNVGVASRGTTGWNKVALPPGLA